jgi:hypothetical protein
MMKKCEGREDVTARECKSSKSRTIKALRDESVEVQILSKFDRYRIRTLSFEVTYSIELVFTNSANLAFHAE